MRFCKNQRLSFHWLFVPLTTYYAIGMAVLLLQKKYMQDTCMLEKLPEVGHQII